MTEPAAPQVDFALPAQLARVSREAALTELASGIAHEINQPLSAIATYAQACVRMLAGPAPDLQEIQAALQQITDQALRAGDAIRSVRHQVGSKPSQRDAANLNDLVAGVALLITPELQREHLGLVLELETDLQQVHVNRLGVQQLLLDLLRNAADALVDVQHGDRQIQLGTRHGDGDTVEVFVRDRGHGVAAELRERLFHPFFSTRRTGAGLGLAIAKSLARSQGGTLLYRPNAPAGAEFYLSLPVHHKEVKT